MSAIMSRNLRELVNTSRLQTGGDFGKKQMPVRYGKKRMLVPLEMNRYPMLPAVQRPATPARGHSLDDLMVHLDVTFVSDWLTRAMAAVEDLQTWREEGDNAISLGHFWLSELSDEKRLQLLEMEYGLVVEQIKLAFRSGIDSGRVTDADMHKLLRAVLREYPEKFGGGDGTEFLDLVWILGCAEKDDYKHLLSAVKCSTKNTQYAQWLLAIRSFALITMVTAVTNFFRRLKIMDESDDLDDVPAVPPPSRPTTAVGGARPTTASSARPGTAVPAARGLSQDSEEAFRAAKLGQADVLYYMFTRGIVAPGTVDGLGRTLLVVAITHDQQDVVAFLLENKELCDLDRAAKTGNTALHIAASNGDANAVKMLLEAGANPAPVNSTSGATPRMVAETFEHHDVVACFDV